jgi:hypothetical protein
MRKTILKADNERFKNKIKFLNEIGYMNKMIADKLNVSAQRVADLKFGSAAPKGEMQLLEEVFATELKDYVDPIAPVKREETDAEIQADIDVLKAEVAILKKIVYDMIKEKAKE